MTIVLTEPQVEVVIRVVVNRRFDVADIDVVLSFVESQRAGCCEWHYRSAQALPGNRSVLTIPRVVLGYN